MPIVRLTKVEFDYLTNADFLADKIKKQLGNVVTKDNYSYDVNWSDDQLIEIEEVCFERLQKVGYDVNYNLTHEGELLDMLIEKINKTE